MHALTRPQTSAFEAERQSFYDNEQHLKSRLQSLTQALNQARSQAAPMNAMRDTDSMSLADSTSIMSTAVPPETTQNTESTATVKEVQLSAEMSDLKLELSTLSTSHASIQNTLILLQTQLVDLKRVNQELQEENESYMILLREKTLNGQYDVMGQVGADSDSEGDNLEHTGDHGSIRSSARSVLDPVDEVDEDYKVSRTVELDPEFQQGMDSEHSDFASEVGVALGGEGESLAGLPLTGPGLDLAAELGRAETKEVLSRTSSPPFEQGSPRRNRSRKGTVVAGNNRKVSSLASEIAAGSSKADIDTLRKEVKSLKDANKALSLYASKIIDRIIAQDGFEHVLSVDYEKSPTTPSAATGFSGLFGSPAKLFEKKKARPQSVGFLNLPGATKPPLPSPTVEKLTTFDSIRPQRNPADLPTNMTPASAIQNTAAAASRRGDKRRSFSLDWGSFSLFGGDKKPGESGRPTNSNLKPLTLGTTISAARKLDTTEDEDDRRERERLQATMKLMGIDAPPPQPIPTIKTTPGESASARASMDGRPNLSTLQASHSTDSAPKTPGARWSLFRSRSTRTPESGSSSPAVTPNPAELTQEALEHAEAAQKLAALDAHEKSLSDQLASGGGGGFTEIQPRSSRRSRRSEGGSNSGSTVWSAGMSKDGHGDD